MTPRTLDFPITARTPVDAADVLLISGIVARDYPHSSLVSVYGLRGRTYCVIANLSGPLEPSDASIFRFHASEDGSTVLDMGPRLTDAGFMNGMTGKTEWYTEQATTDHAFDEGR